MPHPERRLIAQLKKRSSRKTGPVLLGIGDDCALLRVLPGKDMLVTTDFSLEGIHFRRDWQSPECIGHRCLTRGLSDIAAMGGRPIGCFLSLALPPGLPQGWVDRFFAGLLALARRYKVELAGGDTSESTAGVLADIVVLASVKRGQALLRSGTRVGDQIYVTGQLGESAAALRLLSAGKIKRRDIFPSPRIAVGEWLCRNQIASAAIDISDGLSTDLSHICEQSRVGAVIEAEAIPVHFSARNLRNQTEHRASIFDLDAALHGGEDYELLFTAPQSKRVPRRIAGVQVTRIGEIIGGRKMHLMLHGNRQAITPSGWEHFRRNR